MVDDRMPSCVAVPTKTADYWEHYFTDWTEQYLPMLLKRKDIKTKNLYKNQFKLVQK